MAMKTLLSFFRKRGTKLLAPTLSADLGVLVLLQIYCKKFD